MRIECSLEDINGGIKCDKFNSEKMAKGGGFPKFKIDKWNFS